jgi:hypothetical protein
LRVENKTNVIIGKVFTRFLANSRQW